jgi:hypothetical protein
LNGSAGLRAARSESQNPFSVDPLNPLSKTGRSKAVLLAGIHELDAVTLVLEWMR